MKVELTPFYLDNQFLNESDLNSNKTPAKHRDIFRDTLIAKKYGEGEVPTHNLLAGKKIQAPARVRTQYLQPD